jgi:hypothetical protein
MTNQVRSLLMLVGIAILSAASASAQSSSVSGKWDITAQTPHGVLTLALDLKQEGTAVTGTVLNFRNEKQPLQGDFKNGQLTLQSTQGDEMALSATLKADGTLAGQLSVAQGDVNWTAARAKKS